MCCGYKAIACHDCKQLRAIGRPTGTHDVGDVAEVLCADIRGQDDERPRALTVRIAESVHRAFGGAHPVTWMQIACVVVNRVAQCSFKDIDALFIVGMAVRRRHVRSGRHR